MNVETFDVALPHGINLSCRATGAPDAPLVLLLHGFPEAAFAWDEVSTALADRYRCVAPNLRGFERSSAPAEVQSYRAKHLIADIAALAGHLNSAAGRVPEAPLHALVAHEWGGAVAWGFAAQHPQRLERLVIVNSPHPATFQRELLHSPAQQAASAYMNFLCRDDAAARLAADDFALMWRFLAAEGSAWLTDALRRQYRAVWGAGLQGGLNYYRASPLRPPVPGDGGVLAGIVLPPEAVMVHVPTLVIWGERDQALLPALLDGLESYVPCLGVLRVPDASHWIVHEQPALVASAIGDCLAR